MIAVLDLPDLQEQLANQKQKLAEYELKNLAIANAQNIRSDLQEQTLELESIRWVLQCFQSVHLV